MLGPKFFPKVIIWDVFTERYVASALEPPAVSVYPAGGGAGGGAKGAPPYNPWQREERERQAEVRRAIARARRYVRLGFAP